MGVVTRALEDRTRIQNALDNGGSAMKSVRGNVVRAVTKSYAQKGGINCRDRKGASGKAAGQRERLL